MTDLLPYPEIDYWPMVSVTGRLKALGVPPSAIVLPEPIRRVSGRRAHDGRFEVDECGLEWLAFPDAEDIVFWQPRTGKLATWNGRQFALGEAAISNAATYAMGYSLKIYADPLDWLRGKRDGIVVLDWRLAFDRLRDAPRISIENSLAQRYRQAMKPNRMPQLSTFFINNSEDVSHVG